MLPASCVLATHGWRRPDAIACRDHDPLAFIVWWNFLVGHILNNIRGFGSMSVPRSFGVFSIVFGRVHDNCY